MQHGHVQNFDLWTVQRGEGVVGGGGSAGKLFATMLLHFVIPINYMQHDHVLKKLNFDLLTPSPRVVGEGGLQAKHFLPCFCNS